MLKGIIACLLLVLYGGLTAAYILGERQLMFDRLSAMDEMSAVEEAFRRSGLAISNALLVLRQLPLGGDPAVAARETTPYALEVVEQSLRDLRVKYPGVLALHAVTQQRLAALAAQPGPANLIELRESLVTLAREIDREGARAVEHSRAMAKSYREHSDRITIIALALGLAGLVIFGGVTAMFFARLAEDLGLLERRAKEIVSGYRGEPFEVTRRDEVGALTRAVNRMAHDLAGREREIAVAREERAHREKMVALGAMASNLAHEIGNPLATISALAESIDSRQSSGECRACQPDVILEQTRRIAAMTRQIADFAAQGSEDAEPVDVAGMARAVCDFMRFDPRFRSTRMELRLGQNLPVLVVVPGHLREVLMNLLLFGIDEDAALGPAQIAMDAAVRGRDLVLRVRGESVPPDGARLEHTRRLVESMVGELTAPALDGGVCEVVLPAYYTKRSA
ncbi:MAG: HAMP domain-containing protein [Betaproteobacteria bacterium]|nr:HAMP domain-containing protein [Betaproteobacteria bacterium]